MLHFLVLGAALFGLFSMVGKKDAEAPAKIVISESRVANLADNSLAPGGGLRLNRSCRDSSRITSARRFSIAKAGRRASTVTI